MAATCHNQPPPPPPPPPNSCPLKNNECMTPLCTRTPRLQLQSECAICERVSLGAPIHFSKSICLLIDHTLLSILFVVKYSIIVPGYLQICLNSSWYRFHKVLETLLRDFGPCWHESITHLHPWCESSISPHPKGVLMDWDLVTAEAFWV